MLLTASVWGISIVLTVGTLWLFVSEQRLQRRILLSGLRGSLDNALRWVRRRTTALSVVVNTFFLQMWWRYLVHISLRTILVAMSRLYDHLMSYFEYNREQAKEIRTWRKQWQQSNHLTVIADYKEATALSEQEKKRRRRAALDE